jgi:hypothetical protein
LPERFFVKAKEGRKRIAGKIGFIHPQAVTGVLIELAQKV